MTPFSPFRVVQGHRFLHSSKAHISLYKYRLVPRATLENNLAEGNIAQLRGIICQCCSRLTVNICFVLSGNKCNKFASSSMTQLYRIRIDLPNTAVRPKYRHKYMVSRGLHHIPQERGSCDAMFPGNMTLHWRNRATLFIFAHHVTRVGPIMNA